MPVRAASPQNARPFRSGDSNPYMRFFEGIDGTSFEGLTQIERPAEPNIAVIIEPDKSMLELVSSRARESRQCTSSYNATLPAQLEQKLGNR